MNLFGKDIPKYLTIQVAMPIRVELGPNSYLPLYPSNRSNVKNECKERCNDDQYNSAKNDSRNDVLGEYREHCTSISSLHW